MYRYILKKFGLADVSPTVLRVTNLIVVSLTLVAGILTIGGLLASHGPSPVVAIAIELASFPVFLFFFGLYAYIFLAAFYGATRVLSKVPAMFRGLRDGFFSLLRGIVAVLQWCAGVPMALASISLKDWLLVLYLVSGFAVFGLVGYNLYPFATTVVNALPNWLPGPRDYHAVIMTDIFMTAFAFMGLIVILAVILTAVERLVRRYKR